MNHRLCVVAVVLGLTGLSVAEARANCAIPWTYETRVDESSVTICPQNQQSRACPDESGMIREDTSTGETVRLQDFCVGGGYSGSCYVDECVPAGTYRYGFGEPYDCCPACCGTWYYGEVTVGSDLSANCERSAGNSAPSAWAAGAPWGETAFVCASSADGGAVPVDSGARDAAPEGEPPRADDDASCAVSIRPRNAVVVVDLLALAFGLGFLARRCRRQH